MGHHAKSAKYYEMGFALEPDDDDCHAPMNYGLALRGLGRHAEAKPFLERAVAIDRDDGPAGFNLAEYLEEKERNTARAWPLYRRATEVAPTKTHAQAWFGLGPGPHVHDAQYLALSHWHFLPAYEPPTFFPLTQLNGASQLFLYSGFGA